MEGPAHLPLQRGIDHLVLLYPAPALERFGGDTRGKMVAIARQIHDDDMSIRERLPDKPFA
jgi:hypothetical protein